MSAKTIAVDALGEVAFQKRKGSRSLRVKVDLHGNIVVTMPHFVPYDTAIAFVKKHASWITVEQSRRTTTLHDGARIGRVHIMRFIKDNTADKPRVRVTATQIVIMHSGDIDQDEVQSAAKNGAIRALKREAKTFLPKRLEDIARMEGYTYRDVAIKQLRGRWGSCSQNQDITLNCFLMQLPIHLIDYVLYHELAHTRHMNHGADFWQELMQHLPNAKALKSEIRQYQPTIPARSMA